MNLPETTPSPSNHLLGADIPLLADLQRHVDEIGHTERGQDIAAAIALIRSLSAPSPLVPPNIRTFLGKVQGVCMGVAMSGRDHPRKDRQTVDAVALDAVETIFKDIRGRRFLKWIFDERGEECRIGRFDDGDLLTGLDLEVQGQIKAKWQVLIAKAIGGKLNHAPAEKLNVSHPTSTETNIEVLRGHNDKMVVALLKVLEDWWPLVHDRTSRDVVRAQGDMCRKALNNE